MIEDHPFIPIFDRSIKAYKEGDIHAFKEAIREMAESSDVFLKIPGNFFRRNGQGGLFIIKDNCYFNAVFHHMEKSANPEIHEDDNCVNIFYIALLNACIEAGKFKLYSDSINNGEHHPAISFSFQTLLKAEEIELPQIETEKFQVRVYQHKETALAKAANTGNIDLFTHIFSNLEIQFDSGLIRHSRSKNRWLADLAQKSLLAAACYDHHNIVDFIVERFDPKKGFLELNKTFDLDGILVSCAKTKKSSPDMLRKMISLGAKHAPAGRKTALEFAADAGHLEAVKFLYPITDDKMKNLNPILAAEQKGRTEVVEWLFPMMDKSLIKTIGANHKNRRMAADKLVSQWEQQKLSAKHIDLPQSRKMTGL